MIHTSLFRFESGDSDRIPFLQVLGLEKALKQEAHLPGLAWRAGEYKTGILFSRLASTHVPADSWNDRVKACMDTLMAIARWYVVLLPGELKWMDDLHRHLIFYLDQEQ